MPSGTGLDLFGHEFPDRTFDVGIAEQHAVTFAAGLATEGYKPFVAIYSTFLQRAYDQIVHDVAIQRLPVRFVLDRAGLVGADGPTHAGSFDLAYLGCLPEFIMMAAADEAELKHMVATSRAIDDRPSALRFPRGDGVGVEMPAEGIPLEIGRGRVVREGSKIALLSLGTRLAECHEAADQLNAMGLSPSQVTVIENWSPLDELPVVAHANDWAQAQAATIRRMSPISCKLSLAGLRAARGIEIEAALVNEYRMVCEIRNSMISSKASAPS